MSNWYLQSGNESDVVVSTRVRLARNIAGMPFVNRFKKEDSTIILNKIKEITENLGYGLKYIELKDIDDLTKLSLIEKHLISPNFGTSKNKIGAILINEEENICIMVNEEDHLRIQVLNSGFAPEETLNLALEIDKKLEKLVNYAFSEKYGFLTACPTNVGTGLRMSVMVHLPGLTLTGNSRKVLEAVSNLGMNIRGVYGEESSVQGNIYQISNKQSVT